MQNESQDLTPLPLHDNEPPSDKIDVTHIQTGGGSYIDGDVNVGGDFIGHDQIINTRSKQEELKDFLDLSVAQYSDKMSHIVIAEERPLKPYKFLYSFELTDSTIFLGRDDAIHTLHQKVLAAGWTVLHGKSGAGKTSLLRAGLLPRLIRKGYLPIYARTHNDPIIAIKRALAPPRDGDGYEPELLGSLTLHKFLHAVCGNLAHHNKRLVIILDQFEELFIHCPEHSQRQPFIEDLAQCLADNSLPVHFLVSIRAEYYSDLGELNNRIPHIFDNEFWLGPLSREQAQAAITGPLRVVRPDLAYEVTLLETLLNDLVANGMELPHLQIICTELYESLTNDKTVLSLDIYRALGGAEGVLGDYLDKVLVRMKSPHKEIAEQILTALVGAESTRRVLEYIVLSTQIIVDQNVLNQVLTSLVESRLIQRDGETNELAQFELVHDYLVPKVQEMIRENERPIRQALELIERAMQNWRSHGLLLDRKSMSELRPYYDVLRNIQSLGPGARILILRSAIAFALSPRPWIDLVRNDKRTGMLINCLEEHNTTNLPLRERNDAERLLGIRGDQEQTETSMSISYVAAVHPDSVIRETAAITLLSIPTALDKFDSILEQTGKNWRQRWWRHATLLGIWRTAETNKSHKQLFANKYPFLSFGAWLWGIKRQLSRNLPDSIAILGGATIGAGLVTGLLRCLIFIWSNDLNLTNLFAQFVTGSYWGGIFGASIALVMILADGLLLLEREDKSYHHYVWQAPSQPGWITFCVFGFWATLAFGSTHAALYWLTGHSINTDAILVIALGYLAGFVLASALYLHGRTDRLAKTWGALGGSLIVGLTFSLIQSLLLLKSASFTIASRGDFYTTQFAVHPQAATLLSLLDAGFVGIALYTGIALGIQAMESWLNWWSTDTQ